MADKPDDEEQETFVQKAVKVGLITIPLMMYLSWAHKKFFPCPKLKCQPSRSTVLPKSIIKGKRNNKKGKCQDSTPAKQERKRKPSVCAPSADHDQHLSCFRDRKEKDKEPNEAQYMDYMKHSTKDCYETSGKHAKENNETCKKEAEHPLRANQNKRNVYNPCDQQKVGKTDDARSLSTEQSETISPEAFDQLFEEHFQKCVDEFKQHTKRVERELERIREKSGGEPKQVQPDAADKKGNYLECLADLNLDKDLGCGPNFNLKDLDAPYVVKDYKCKKSKRSAAENIQTGNTENTKNTYLECLTDLNMDKHFEEQQESQRRNLNYECCPKVNEEVDSKKKMEECQSESYTKSEEDICENRNGSSMKDSWENSSVKNPKSDDCGCDPYFNTKDTDKYGTVKGEPCAYRSVRETDTDDDALKDFWHACGPPKGLRTGCRADGCKDPSDQRKQF